LLPAEIESSRKKEKEGWQPRYNMATKVQTDFYLNLSVKRNFDEAFASS